MADQVNYYEVLGVPRTASQSEVRNAYRRLAKDRHPDRPGGSEREFSLLQEANAVLSDPARRRRHDEDLDLAYAAAQLSDLDFSPLEDELAARRRERESASSGPGLGERIRERFGRKEDTSRGGRSEDGRRRGRYVEREARWYEPHYFDPEPITWSSGAVCFFGSFLAFIVAGQIGLWAGGAVEAGILDWLRVLDPFMFIIYTFTGLVAAYLSFRKAGYWAVGLVFVAALVVGQRGGPEGLLQFGTLGILLLLVAIYLGTRRDQAARAR
jgi:molecular chaperone DnaJ